MAVDMVEACGTRDEPATVSARNEQHKSRDTRGELWWLSLSVSCVFDKVKVKVWTFQRGKASNAVLLLGH